MAQRTPKDRLVTCSPSLAGTRAEGRFEEALLSMPKLATLVSAANMRKKLGADHHRACALTYLSLQRMALSEQQQALVQKNLAACAEALPDGALAALDDDLVDELACQRFKTTADEAAA